MEWKPCENMSKIEKVPRDIHESYNDVASDLIKIGAIL